VFTDDLREEVSEVSDSTLVNAFTGEGKFLVSGYATNQDLRLRLLPASRQMLKFAYLATS
jgi:hypothetical protein